MLEAYETGVLRGDQLLKVRRLLEKRKALGKKFSTSRATTERITTPAQLLKTYQQEVGRQHLIIKKSEINQQRLLFIITALRKLLSEDYFQALLQNEGLSDMPEVLSQRVYAEVAA